MEHVWNIVLPVNEHYEEARYSIDISTCANTMRTRLLNAKLIGHGASSMVWDIGQGQVVKITTDPEVWKLAKWQHNHKAAHLPRIDELSQLPVILTPLLGKKEAPWESWYAIVQKKYQPVPSHVWEQISKAANHIGKSNIKSRPGWARNKEGFPAHGKLACEHLSALQLHLSQYTQPSFQHAAVALQLLSQWWKEHKPHGGLDIDNASNWAWDEGTKELILLDPVYGNDHTESTYHWSFT